MPALHRNRRRQNVIESPYEISFTCTFVRQLASTRQSLQTPVAVIFDDAYEHEAWNDTSDTRVVRRFVRKPLHFPANLINWLLLHLAVFTPFIREGIEKEKAWERKFYTEAEALRNR